MSRISGTPGQGPNLNPDFQVSEEKHTDGQMEKPENPAAHQNPTPDESRSKSMKPELNLAGSLQQSQLQAKASVLANGSRGPEVEKLQDSLIASGYMTADQKATGPGVFGPQTEAALKAFQKDHGLKSDGIFGPETQKAMGGQPKRTEKLLEEKEKKLSPSKLESRADAIHRACEGLGTDEQALFNNLQGLTNQERKELDRIYQQKYGVSLEQEIRGELTGDDLDKALSLLNGGTPNRPQNDSEHLEAEHRSRRNREIE